MLAGPGEVLLDFDGCRELDRRSIAAGFPEQQLMGQAALASAHALLPRVRSTLRSGGRIVLLCGSGNNGGDGYALAFMLCGAERSLSEPLRAGALLVVSSGRPRTEAAQLYAGKLAQCGIEARAADDFQLNALALTHRDLIVEALLGIGQTDAPRGVLGQLAREILLCRQDAQMHPYLVALDVPVGLTETRPVHFAAPGRIAEDEPDTFALPDEVHSYGVEKLALRLDPALATTNIRVLPIGFLPEQAGLPDAGRAAADPTRAGHAPARLLCSDPPPADAFRRRMRDHKYSAGYALLGGGSPGMEGALLLGARAFFAAGGGILQACTDGEPARTWGDNPAVLFRGPEHLTDIKLPPVAAWGPGLAAGEAPRFARALAGLCQRSRAEMGRAPLLILDAGILSEVGSVLAGLSLAERTRVLLTPHGGEWKRLGGTLPDCVDALREAAQFHRERFGCYTLIKGPVSCLLGPDGEVWVFSRPNPSLAIAGSGDVLVGILAAVAARNQEMALPQIVEFSLRLHSWAGSAAPQSDATGLVEAIRALSS